MKNILIIIVVILLTSCFKDEVMSLSKKNYYSDLSNKHLKVNGYFFTKSEDAKYFCCFVLYNNGIYYDQGCLYNNSLYEIDKLICDTTRYKFDKKLKYNWGLFNVSNDTIVIEKWIIGIGSSNYLINKMNGKILNDSTFVLYGEIGIMSKSAKKKYENQIDTFHFRYLNPKPDSSNSFIK
jgi:hypothetical protein